VPTDFEINESLFLPGAGNMFVRFSLVVCLLIGTSHLLADEPSLGPVIEGYGPTYPIDDRDVALVQGAHYKVVFDMSGAPDDNLAPNQELVSVARFLNMHGRNGVPLENMDIAVVVHGAALKSLLTHEAHGVRYKGGNPDYELLLKLDSAGVNIYVCGQSMRFRDVGRKELASPVQVALSAMTMLTVLQNNGYALLP
jgi:intracellular sulfur oxidation DsrE/DsrF family protein